MPSGTSQTTIKRARGVLEEADLLRVERRQMYRGKPVQLTSTPVGRETTPLYTLRIPCGEYTDALPGESVGVPPGEYTDAPPITKQKENPQEQNADHIRQVFDVWVDATGKTANTKLDRNRKQKIAGALAMYPLQDVLDAVVGWKNDPFYCGQNDRGKQYNSLDLLLRDAEHIEKFRDLARTGPAGRAGAAPKAWDALRRISGEI
jgi:hypothetical protein